MNAKIVTHINFAKGFRGGERQTQLLVENLALLGYKQRLLLREGSKLTQRCQGIKNLTIVEISKPYIFHLNAVKDSSILHAHETKALQFAFIASKVFNIPYIVTRRVDNSIKNNFFNALLYKNALKAVALSKAIAEGIHKVTKEAKIEIIPSAYSDLTLNKAEVEAIKARFQGKFLVGHVGALDDRHKGQSLLIDAAKELLHKEPNIHFLLVGGGDDEAMLKKQAEGLKNVSFEGFVNNVSDYISSFDLFVFPSRNEGLGSILLDVMQLEVPIIANNVGGIPDIIQDRKNGLLLQKLTKEEIIKNILELKEKRDFAKELTQNAKKEISKYSAKNMAHAYEKIYKAFLL